MEGQVPERRQGRRPTMYYWRNQSLRHAGSGAGEVARHAPARPRAGDELAQFPTAKPANRRRWRQGRQGRSGRADNRNDPHRREERYQAWHALADTGDAFPADRQWLDRREGGRSGIRHGAQDRINALSGERHRPRQPRAAGREGQEEHHGFQRRGAPCLSRESGASRGMGRHGRGGTRCVAGIATP